MSSPKSGISKDLLRHVGDYTHHVERSKDQRLDRLDGTGRGHEGVKKGGAGKHNWGTPLDDTIDMPSDEADAGPAAVSPRDFVTNDAVKTLDEYEALKAKA